MQSNCIPPPSDMSYGEAVVHNILVENAQRRISKGIYGSVPLMSMCSVVDELPYDMQDLVAFPHAPKIQRHATCKEHGCKDLERLTVDLRNNDAGRIRCHHCHTDWNHGQHFWRTMCCDPLVFAVCDRCKQNIEASVENFYRIQTLELDAVDPASASARNFPRALRNDTCDTNLALAGTGLQTAQPIRVDPLPPVSPHETKRCPKNEPRKNHNTSPRMDRGAAVHHRGYACAVPFSVVIGNNTRVSGGIPSDEHPQDVICDDYKNKGTVEKRVPSFADSELELKRELMHSENLSLHPFLTKKADRRPPHHLTDALKLVLPMSHQNGSPRPFSPSRGYTVKPYTYRRQKILALREYGRRHTVEEVLDTKRKQILSEYPHQGGPDTNPKHHLDHSHVLEQLQAINAAMHVSYEEPGQRPALWDDWENKEKNSPAYPTTTTLRKQFPSLTLKECEQLERDLRRKAYREKKRREKQEAAAQEQQAYLERRRLRQAANPENRSALSEMKGREVRPRNALRTDCGDEEKENRKCTVHQPATVLRGADEHQRQRLPRRVQGGSPARIEGQETPTPHVVSHLKKLQEATQRRRARAPQQATSTSSGVGKPQQRPPNGQSDRPDSAELRRFHDEVMARAEQRRQRKLSEQIERERQREEEEKRHQVALDQQRRRAREEMQAAAKLRHEKEHQERTVQQEQERAQIIMNRWAEKRTLQEQWERSERNRIKREEREIRCDLDRRASVARLLNQSNKA